MQSSCPFCLDNHLLKTDIVAESPGAFLTLALSNPGNYLVVPKIHTESLLDLPDDWWKDVKELLPHIPNLGEHYNLSVNIGKVAGQSVKHIHFWVIPRTSDLATSGKGLATLIENSPR